jgi:hypothetical protein
MLKMVVSLDHLNIIANILFIGTSISVGVSAFDFTIIMVDLLSLFYFQFELFKMFNKHKGKKTPDVKNLQEKHLLLSAFYMQNGDGLKLPVSFILNGISMARFGIFFLLKDYECLFGVILLLIGLAVYLVLTAYFKRNRSSFVRVFKLVYITQILENSLFTVMAIVAISPSTFRENDSYCHILTWVLLIWMITNIFLTFAILIVPDHLQSVERTLKHGPQYGKSKIYPHRGHKVKNKLIKNRKVQFKYKYSSKL